jgi:carotenoid cleavage dioxygenase
VLFSVYSADTQTNEIRILDASDLSQPPLASIELNRRIPAGFHGAWIPGEISRP